MLVRLSLGLTLGRAPGFDPRLAFGFFLRVSGLLRQVIQLRIFKVVSCD